MLKLKLMLTQPPTELELELGLSLAKMHTYFKISCSLYFRVVLHYTRKLNNFLDASVLILCVFMK